MECEFFCPDCRAEHESPAFAHLGYRVICLDCAISAEIVVSTLPAVDAVPESKFAEIAA